MPSATLNLYMLYYEGLAAPSSLITALISLCSFANMLWESKERYEEAKDTKLNLQGHTGGVSSAAPFADGKKLVTGSADKTAKVWDAEDGTCLLTLEGHTGGVLSAAVAPDGHSVLTAGGDNKVIRHDRL